MINLTKRAGVLLLPILLSACAVGDDLTICEKNPSACASARNAKIATDGAMNVPGNGGSTVPQLLGPVAGRPNMVPPNTDTVALERGDVMRIWTAPYVDTQGALHVAGYTFVEMRQRAWEVGQTDFYWTGAR